MAAPRATQFIALRNLARAGRQPSVRSLHMTGPATYASPVLSKERPSSSLPRDIAGLRAECRRRNLDYRGNQQELTARIHADELTSSRGFSTVTDSARRPTVLATSSEAAAAPVRHFNVSRELKAVGDSSTIDFAYLPQMDVDAGTNNFAQVRVPILPDNYSFDSTQALPREVEQVVMKPEISTMSADAVFLPMADMHDGHAGGIDFHAMADRVAAGLRRMQVPVDQQAGMMKQLWNDMVDDVLGLAARKPLHP